MYISLFPGSVTSHGTQRTDVTFPDVPWSEWHIDARDIQVARRDDGREWKLGGGAFGEVSVALHEALQHYTTCCCRCAAAADAQQLHESLPAVYISAAHILILQPVQDVVGNHRYIGPCCRRARRR